MWKTAFLGVFFQVLISVLLMFVIGYYFNWGLNRTIIIGFTLSLSSSAVVIKLMDEKKEINTPVGQSVLSILLMQDMVIVPMLLVTDFLSGEKPTLGMVFLQILGSLIILFVFWYIINNKTIKVPFADKIKSDHEAQVFIAILFSFGLAILTSLMGLSAALGAFFAGIIVHAADATEWVHNSLHSFRVAFVSMFFVSIGMLIDLNFLVENYLIILFLLVSVYITNHLINTLILQYFCRNWKNSIYGGAMLAQVGELGFIILGTAYLNDSISNFTYQLAIITISLTLLISPIWILVTESIVNKRSVI
jgi:CPA2 family monovalent cation:H+ antiporter-2